MELGLSTFKKALSQFSAYHAREDGLQRYARNDCRLMYGVRLLAAVRKAVISAGIGR
jgi:hypothetical protein